MKAFKLIPAAVVAALFTTLPVFAVESSSSKEMSYTGEIMTTSPAAHTITVRGGNGPWTETFRIALDAKLAIDGKPDTNLRDYEFGQKVKVDYRAESLGETAVSVSELPQK